MNTNQIRWAKDLLKKADVDHRDFSVVRKGLVYECTVYFKLPDLEELRKGDVVVNYGMSVKAPEDPRCRALEKAIAYARSGLVETRAHEPATALWGFILAPRLEEGVEITKKQLREAILQHIFNRASAIATRLPRDLQEALSNTYNVKALLGYKWESEPAEKIPLVFAPITPNPLARDSQ